VNANPVYTLDASALKVISMLLPLLVKDGGKTEPQNDLFPNLFVVSAVSPS